MNSLFLAHLGHGPHFHATDALGAILLTGILFDAAAIIKKIAGVGPTAGRLSRRVDFCRLVSKVKLLGALPAWSKLRRAAE